MATFLLIVSVLLLSVGMVESFRHPSAAAVTAYAGLVALLYSGYSAPLDQRTLLFWAIAVIIICGISMAGGDRIPNGYPVARYYVAGGALVGMIAGLTLGQSGMIIGSSIGAILGGLAWNRTPSGRTSTEKIWTIILSTGLPAVVTMTLTGQALIQLMIRNG